MDDTCIAGVHRGTVVRGEGELPTGEVRITDCHDSVVYILAPLQSALLSGCSDCTIVLGAVGAMLRMERCDRVQVGENHKHIYPLESQKIASLFFLQVHLSFTYVQMSHGSRS